MKLDYNYYMDLALKEAEAALNNNEVPVGALLIDVDGTVLTRAHNLKETKFDVTSHAEIEVIRKASFFKKNWRLDNLTLIVTLSPCLMCVGAIKDSRIKRVVIGCNDDNLSINEKELINNIYFENNIEVIKGIKEKESKELLNKFFKENR